ncbi:hypothetical protein FIBSPDRAFT_865010 [Athelia psychrophila]|uniref:60S ribosomal protein L27 n=1 Tax=Athelia psychrophila TaxID=1759441 RepID=A0A166G0G5_9AGAM|nr:hypothetical protein FIBSPDRAFT_865010 [Fibularhizoctonia sp. CBS 109695]
MVKVIIVLQGREESKNVIVIKQLDEGTKDRPYPHALVADRLQSRSKVKPFIKTINYSHLFPTRYALELDGLKGAISAETLKEPS